MWRPDADLVPHGVAILGRVRRTWLIAAISCCVLLAVPSGVGAQTDDVFVDPDSPTGREYDIPLERARRNADPAPSAASGGSRSRGAALFGEGITETEAAESGGGDGRASGDRKQRSPTRPLRESRRSIPPAVKAAIRQPGAPDASDRTLLTVAAGAGLVLASGLLFGYLLRRRRG